MNKQNKTDGAGQNAPDSGPGSDANDASGATAQTGMAMAPEGVERLALAFERSARRWEMIIYPALIIFTIFAAYGFYQVYTLSRDMRSVAGQLEPQMGAHMTRLTQSMSDLTDNIGLMSRSIQDMQEKVANMSVDTRVIARRMQHLESMDAQMLALNRSMSTMAVNADRMRYSMGSMNRSISKPMSFMNSFMPW